MIVVLKLQDFEVKKVPYGPPTTLDVAPMIGYLPVYGTVEDAKKDFPNGPFREIAFIGAKEMTP